MKPLTFLFGPNSSGKSSFLKAMMFLSKNLFPLNTGKTIYKISDDVDLGSYRDIVTNNEVDRNISFEFDLEGKYRFPSISVLENEEFDDSNFFDLISQIKLEKEDYVNFEMCFTFKIVFSNANNLGEVDHINQYSLSIVDNSNKSEYYYCRSEGVSEDEARFFAGYDHSGLEGEEFAENCEICKITFLNNENISRIFSSYLGYALNLKYFDKSPYEFNPPFYFNIPTKTEILSDQINYDTNTVDDQLISKNWQSYNKSQKINFYYEILKFCYLIKNIIPNKLYDFLNLKHLPTTRMIPKDFYKLSSDEFDNNEYYGLLNPLFKSQKKSFPKNEDRDNVSIDDLFNIINRKLKSLKSIKTP